MTEQSETYQNTLKAARELDPEVDLVLDTTAEGCGLDQGHEGRRTRKDLMIQNVIVAAAGGWSDRTTLKAGLCASSFQRQPR